MSARFELVGASSQSNITLMFVEKRAKPAFSFFIGRYIILPNPPKRKHNTTFSPFLNKPHIFAKKTPFARILADLVQIFYQYMFRYVFRNLDVIIAISQFLYFIFQGNYYAII